MVDLKGKDILHGAQFTREEIEHIMDVAEAFQERLKAERSLDLMRGYVIGTLFFEPSTRTRLSFETAMHRLGGDVVGFASATATSVAKGESLADTVRTVDQYVDLIVIRHPQVGSAQIAADAAESPVINGGDGAGQHPTQALLDLFTIRSERGRVDGLTILLCGDLKYGRTVHAGVELYKHYDCRLIFVSPDALRMPPEITARLREHGVRVEETPDLEAALAEADVLYMTRIQKERFFNEEDYLRLRDAYVLTADKLALANPDLIVMHPLPRVTEISPEVDGDTRAVYFRQAHLGVFVRMALIARLLGVA